MGSRGITERYPLIKGINRKEEVKSMENEKQKLEELYWKNNLSSREISRLFGVSHNIILKRMKKYQISRRPLARKMKTPAFMN